MNSDKFYVGMKPGRESPNRQCYECTNSFGKSLGRSRFHCKFMNKDYETWHMDVPSECPCKGEGWKLDPQYRIENWKPVYTVKGDYWYLYDVGNNAKVNELRFKSEQEAINWKLNYENKS